MLINYRLMSTLLSRPVSDYVEKLCGLVVDEVHHSPQDNPESEEEVTAVQAPKQQPSIPEEAKICHYLRLPAEIRLQIYAYTDIIGRTIEVLSLPTVQTPQVTQYYRTCINNPIARDLLYRLESESDPASRSGDKPGPSSLHRALARLLPAATTKSPSTPSDPAKKNRCFSVHDLFSLTIVCRQIRADTNLLVYEHSEFAFSNRNYNYDKALRAFIQPLTEREMSAIRTIYWPFLSVLVFRRTSCGIKIEEHDQASVEPIAALEELRRVVFRYNATESAFTIDEHSETEALELESLVAHAEEQLCAIGRQCFRLLAIRGSEL